tara:strand:- start:277 stop:2322 length:2046 start_codon:yes stop_codon:yes gene_type:complete
VPIDTTGLDFSETRKALMPDRLDIREISRVSIIGLSFHVFMGTCAVMVGLTWVELLAFSAEGYADQPRFRAFSIYAAIVVGIYVGNFLARRLGVSPYQLAVARVWLLFVFFSMAMFVGPYTLGWHTHAATAAVFSSILTAIMYSAKRAYASLAWFGMLAATGFLMNPTREPLIDLLASPVSAAWGIASALIIPFSVAAMIAHVISRLLAAYDAHHLQLLDNSEKLMALATTDPLTGFQSRGALQPQFEKQVKVAAAHQKSIVMALVDLDNLKGINTFFGHSAGDEALQFAAQHIRAVVPNASHLRLGGDEFLLIMTRDDEEAAIDSLLRRITHELEFKFGEQSISISMSLGYSTATSADKPLTQLIAEADLAMRKAKRQGKSLTFAYVAGDSVPSAFTGGLPKGVHVARANRTSKSEIPAATVGAAILDGQINFALQPIIDARTGEIIATEALLRWYLSDGSVVPLVDFLSTFVSLEWQAPYHHSINSTRLAILDGVRAIKDIDVHFNFSVESLGLSTASKLNNAVGSDLRGLVVEISEKESSATLKNGIPLQDWLLSAGGKYALDDFGKGLSNLDRLSQLTIDLVKFDQSLIKDITDNKRRRAAIRHVTALCEELDIRFIAEGVETVEQESTLLELGVFAHQGFLRGEPIKKSAFLNLLRSNTQLARPTNGIDDQNFGLS